MYVMYVCGTMSCTYVVLCHVCMYVVDTRCVSLTDAKVSHTMTSHTKVSHTKESNIKVSDIKESDIKVSDIKVSI